MFCSGALERLKDMFQESDLPATQQETKCQPKTWGIICLTGCRIQDRSKKHTNGLTVTPSEKSSQNGNFLFTSKSCRWNIWQGYVFVKACLKKTLCVCLILPTTEANNNLTKKNHLSEEFHSYRSDSYLVASLLSFVALKTLFLCETLGHVFCLKAKGIPVAW